jgi:hypothetical protein
VPGKENYRKNRKTVTCEERSTEKRKEEKGQRNLKNFRILKEKIYKLYAGTPEIQNSYAYIDQ